MTRRILYFVLLTPLALLIAWLLSPFAPKLRASFRRRRGIWRRFRAALSRRDPTRPLVWFHVASAGEFLQAEPLLRRFRDAGWQVAVTLASVSGHRWTQRIASWPELVWADLLPWDVWGSARRLYAGLMPRLVVYLQADLWPGLVWQGTDREIAQALVVGRLGPGSPKLRHGVQGWFARDLYGCLDLILAATEADRAQLAKLVTPHAALRVGGDPGIETVLLRVREAQDATLPPEFAGGATIVCGSTWPADEAHLLPALRTVLTALPSARLVLAPHEPTEPRLRELTVALGPFGVARLSDMERGVPVGEPVPRVVLVDSVGRLAGLYRAGTLAYVGGAFSTGVHNVAEPAAAGLVALFGPRHGNSAVAADLLGQGCALSAESSEALSRQMLALLNDPERCAKLGAQARTLIEARAGAAQQNFDALAALVPLL